MVNWELKTSTEKNTSKVISTYLITNTWYKIQYLQSKLIASLNEGGKSAKIVI